LRYFIQQASQEKQAVLVKSRTVNFAIRFDLILNLNRRHAFFRRTLLPWIIIFGELDI